VSAVLASPAAKESQMDSVRALQHAASPGSGTRRRPQAAPGAYRPTRQQKGATKMIFEVWPSCSSAGTRNFEARARTPQSSARGGGHLRGTSTTRSAAVTGNRERVGTWNAAPTSAHRKTPPSGTHQSNDPHDDPHDAHRADPNVQHLQAQTIRSEAALVVSTIDRTSGFTFLAYVELNPITVGARVTACGPNRHKALAAQERSCISRDQHTNGQPG